MGENEVVYTVLPQKQGKLTYFLAEFTHKEPLSERHTDAKGEIIAQLPPELYKGKFGPGAIIA